MTDRARELLELAFKALVGELTTMQENALFARIQDFLDVPRKLSSREILTDWSDIHPEDVNYLLRERSRKHLAEPEVKREALSEEEIEKVWPSGYDRAFEDFKDGVRFAEKHHGIGGWDE